MEDTYITPPTEPALERWLTPRVRLVLLGLLLLASPLLWLALKPLVWTRQIEIGLTSRAVSGRAWAIEWQEWGGGAWNGRWVDLAALSSRPDTLEIRVSGVSSAPGARDVGFHLYQVTSGPEWSLSRADLKAALAKWQAAPDSMRALGWAFEGAWRPGAGDGGGVFCASRGLVRIPVPASAAQRGVGVQTEKTVMGGPVELSFGGGVTSVDTYAASWESLQIPLRRRVPPDLRERLVIHAALPAFPIADVRLTLGGSDDAAACEPLLMHTQVFGIGLPDRRFEWAEGGAMTPGEPLHLGRAIKTTVPVHAIGTLLVGLGMLAAWAGVFFVVIPVCGGAVEAARRRFHRWRGDVTLPASRAAAFGGAFWVVLGVVTLVHVWMAAWAPVIFLADGVDYVVNAQVLWQKLSGPLGAGESWWGHVHAATSHLGAYRMPGVSLVLAGFMALFSQPEPAMVWAQALGGVLISVMCFDVARRFMPRGAALLVMLLVGVDPVGLIWERHIMSEATLSFALVLWMWLLVRLFFAARQESSHRGSLASWAIVLGLVAGFAPLIRGNALLLLAATPPAIVFTLFGAARPGRWALLALLAGLTSGVVIAPWVAHVNARYGKPTVFIGAGFANFGFTYIAGLIDPNQTRVFDEAEYGRAAALGPATGNPYPLAALVNASSRLAAAPGRDPWVQQDYRSQVMAAESRARAGPLALRRMIAGFVHHTLRLGPSPSAPTSYWGSNLFGPGYEGLEDMNWAVSPANHSQIGVFPDVVRKVYERTRRDVSYLKKSPNPPVLRAMYFGFEYVRMALGGLFLIGGVMALREWNRPLLVVWGVCLVTILAFCYLVFGGEERYVEPLFAPMTLLGVFGLARVMQEIARPPRRSSGRFGG